MAWRRQRLPKVFCLLVGIGCIASFIWHQYQHALQIIISSNNNEVHDSDSLDSTSGSLGQFKRNHGLPTPSVVQVLAEDNQTMIEYNIPTARRSCAINLYGLPRAFASLVLPSLIRNVIAQNPTCDYYMHLFDKKQEGQSRSGQGGTLDSPETVMRFFQQAVHQMNPQAIVAFDIDTDDSFQTKRANVIRQVATTQFTINGTRQYLYVRGGSQHAGIPPETTNVLKMWHSQEAVWNLMNNQGRRIHNNNNNNPQYTYDYVAMLRNDVFFMTPLNILESSPFPALANRTWAMAVVPGFGRFPVSDRMIYGPYSAVEPWATSRFASLPEGAKLIHQMGPPPDLRPIIHSETFVDEIVFSKIRDRGFFIVPHPTACFFRARADESLWVSDCFKKSLPSIVLNLVGNGFASVEKSYPRIKRLVEDILQRQCHRLQSPKSRDGTWQMNCARKNRWLGIRVIGGLLCAGLLLFLILVYTKRRGNKSLRLNTRSKLASNKAWSTRRHQKSSSLFWLLPALGLVPTFLGYWYILRKPFDLSTRNELILSTTHASDAIKHKTKVSPHLPSKPIQSIARIGQKLTDELRSKSCAINFFGYPQSFESLALPSILQNVVSRNPTCDYYMHFYRSEDVSPERIQRLFQEAVHRVNPNALIQFAYQTEASFISKYNVEFHEEKRRIQVNGELLASKVEFQEGADSIKGRFFDVAKLWHSQNEVWNLMKQSNRMYDYVAMLRNDMFYMTPLDILDPTPFGLMVNHSLSMAVIPGFSRIPVSDRMIYGPYAAVEPWAGNHLRNLKRILKTLRKTGVPAIHSESFVDAFVLPEIQNRGFFPVEHPRACFFAIGPNETLQLSDCYWRSRASILFNIVGKEYNPIGLSYSKMKERVEAILKTPCRRLVSGERKDTILDCASA